MLSKKRQFENYLKWRQTISSTLWCNPSKNYHRFGSMHWLLTGWRQIWTWPCGRLKKRGLCTLCVWNDWRSPVFITGVESVISPEDWVMLFWWNITKSNKVYIKKKEKRLIHACFFHNKIIKGHLENIVYLSRWKTISCQFGCNYLTVITRKWHCKLRHKVHKTSSVVV